MEYVPEVLPLLPWDRYRIRVSFILPAILARAEGTRRHSVRVDVFSSGATVPLSWEEHVETADPSRAYAFDVNHRLTATGLDPYAPSYVVLTATTISSTPLPSVLKVIGYWVSYQNAHVYAVIPSSVQYASSRMVVGANPELALVDYFGEAVVSSSHASMIAMINPFPGISHATISFRAPNGSSWKHEITLAPRTVAWMDVAALAAERGMSTGAWSVTITSSHRVVSYGFIRDRQTGWQESADHTIPWVNRVPG